MKKSYLLLILPVLFGGTLSAQNPSTDTVGVTVYFRQGLSTLEPSFRDNGRRLDTFFQQVAELRRDTMRRVHSVRIMAFSSPEGSSDCNSRLSERRAFRLADFTAPFDRPSGFIVRDRCARGELGGTDRSGRYFGHAVQR